MSAPRVIVIVRGGLVDDVRASEPIDAAVCDLDGISGTCEALENKGEPCSCFGNDDGDQAAGEKEFHEELAELFHEAVALAVAF